MQKVMLFKDCEVLKINISDIEVNKKIDKFYAGITKSFLNYCEKKLYKKAAEQFLICGAGEFKIFSASLNHEIKYVNEMIKIYLDININGENKRKVYTWTVNGELIKPPKSNAGARNARPRIDVDI